MALRKLLPKWIRPYMPNYTNRIAMVSLDDKEPFRAYRPLNLLQIIGGRTWSISLVRYSTPTPLFTKDIKSTVSE